MLDKSHYFDALYLNNDDPWNYANRWYEKRKREICLALLLKPMYENILEIGCSNGVFSQKLSERAMKLLCIDGNAHAIKLAKARLKDFKHISVLQQKIPNQYPNDHYDLIILSEIAYYLSRSELDLLINCLKTSLMEGGMVLACHWRYPIEGFDINGEKVHEVLKKQLNIHHYLSLNDPDFLIDIWTHEKTSLASQEGLI